MLRSILIRFSPAVLLAVFLSVCVSLAESSTAVVMAMKGAIGPASAEFVEAGIKRAVSLNAEALIIELDTPGGLDTSMRSIVQDIFSSPVPVVVYVSPSGARAASAGVFITMAAHIAAMAPGTNIGAAHPVGVGGSLDKTMAEKAENDAVAYLKSIAEQRGRNAAWAESAVRKSVSATETEALNSGIVDLLSKDLRTLLADIDGKVVKTSSGERRLSTARAEIVREEGGLRRKILAFLTDPNVAYMLMLLGFYGLFFELTNPGSIFPGVLGGICLILAFYAFQTLPVNYAGLLLIVLGIILFILEVKIISHGVLTIGGVISMVLGSLMLFESPGPFMKISLFVILPAVIMTAFFFITVLGLAYKAYKKKPVTGVEGLTGTEGRANSDITGEGGMVTVQGELWSAFSDEPIPKGEKVTVEAITGLKLKVRRIQ